MINLDQPPEKRWDALTFAKTTEVVVIVPTVLYMLLLQMTTMIGEIKRLGSIILNGSLIPLIDHDLVYSSS